MNALLTGYKEGNSRIISGAEYYYKLRGISKEYNKLPLDEKYDDITTLSWGLPIDKEKYNEIRDIKKNGVNSLKLILRK